MAIRQTITTAAVAASLAFASPADAGIWSSIKSAFCSQCGGKGMQTNSALDRLGPMPRVNPKASKKVQRRQLAAQMDWERRALALSIGQPGRNHATSYPQGYYDTDGDWRPLGY